VYDVEYGIRLFESFFEHFSELEEKIIVDWMSSLTHILYKYKYIYHHMGGVSFCKA
jgi:hypothetical protein